MLKITPFVPKESLYTSNYDRIFFAKILEREDFGFRTKIDWVLGMIWMRTEKLVHFR